MNSIFSCFVKISLMGIFYFSAIPSMSEEARGCIPLAGYEKFTQGSPAAFWLCTDAKGYI
jgi:hypothetical protein